MSIKFSWAGNGIVILKCTARESAIKLRDRMEASATHLAVDIETSIMNILRSHFLSPTRKEENI